MESYKEKVVEEIEKLLGSIVDKYYKDSFLERFGEIPIKKHVSNFDDEFFEVFPDGRIVRYIVHSDSTYRRGSEYANVEEFYQALKRDLILEEERDKIMVCNPDGLFNIDRLLEENWLLPEDLDEDDDFAI